MTIHSKTLDQLDATHSWHPFGQMKEYLENPRIHIEKGEGCWLFDTDGNKYLDCNASLWTNVHGHNHPELNQAIANQLSQIAHSSYLGLSHKIGTLLSEKLIALAPSKLQRVFYCDNGAGSIEVALKLSFQYRQLVNQPEKTEVIALKQGYHGDTFGAMSVGDAGTWHHWFNNWMFPCHKIPSPAGNNSAQSLESLNDLLEERAHSISCLIMEPLIQGPAGMLLSDPGYLKKVETLCKKHDVHLILDEVFVGMGRTGTIFACSQENIQPDFLCISKGLTGGYLPMGATLTTDTIYEAFLNPFESFKSFIHGHTHSGNPLCCAAALKNLELLEKLIHSGKLSETTNYFQKAIQKHFAGHPNVKEIRQRNLIAAIDLYPGGDTNNEFPLEDRVGLQICIQARKHKLLIRPLLDSLLIVPPLIISKEEIDFLCSNLIHSINSTVSKYEAVHTI